MRKMFSENQVKAMAKELAEKSLKNIYVLELQGVIVNVGGHYSSNTLSASFILNEIPSIDNPFQIGYAWDIEGQYTSPDLFLAVKDDEIIVVNEQSIELHSAEIRFKDLLGNIIASLSL